MPSDWILDECYPEDFAWANPSKIHKSEVFRLLDHWRQHEKDGLTALIWNWSCDLFNDGEMCSRTITIKKRKEVPSSSASSNSSPPFSLTINSSPKDSEEEDFRADLARIPSDNSDSPKSHSSPNPQSPSPLPRRSISRIPEEIHTPVAGSPLFCSLVRLSLNEFRAGSRPG